MSALRDKVAVVTGAAGGIGRALSLALAAEGCRLGLLSLTPARLTPLAEELKRSGTAVSAHCGDMGNRSSVESALAGVESDLGPVDVLIHNAGVAPLTLASDPNLDDLEKALQINYLGGVYAIGAVLPGMLQRGRGHIVAISSLSAWRGMPHSAAYSASKAALSIYLEGLRPALGLRGIQVCTAYSGFVRTPMSDAMPFRWKLPMLSPERVAAKVVRAIHAGRREIAFPLHQSLIMRLMYRLPAWAYDFVVANLGRYMLKQEY